ncbi:hypothetical protein JQ604_18550 [Bradyrhizobium jicamae]|uniref:hypothetical protein n=1 Tax=Bradyrhizobium jicamae TaxID=280332 RepID=UPI001BA46518|nr:hypothetical protein [Bradyrhizobium jicamae]MBR0754190.1 hypothetical protein [Bradyrhizobium jicamae]
MPTPFDVVKVYILAKDGNRPFLMKQAFAENAELEMIVKTDAISFPSSAKGVVALEDILVRRFGIDYENVFTFCLTEPPAVPCEYFPCHWLVGMSAKANGQIRVGCGRYDWYFGASGHVEKLVIAIEVMKVLAADELSACMAWLSALPYPWCSAGEAMKRMPALQGLADIKAYLMEARPLASS